MLSHELLTGRTPWSSLTDKQVIKHEIANSSVAPPQCVSQEAGHLVCSLLRHDHRLRLGTKRDDEVMRAPFFHGVDWDATLRLAVSPAFVPAPRRNLDERYAKVSL